MEIFVVSGYHFAPILDLAEHSFDHVAKFQEKTCARVLDVLGQKPKNCSVVVFQSDNNVKEWLDIFEDRYEQN